MTEKEKQQKGLLYYGSDQELSDARDAAKQLCFEFNFSSPKDGEKRQQIIKKLFGSAGAETWIEPMFQCDYGYHIHVGDRFYVNHNCVMLDCAPIHFGDNVLIGPNCGFYTAGHPLDVERRNQWLEYAKPITVGDNVWIGGNTVVLPGVTIGNDVVIGAGSVVTKDIPSGVVAVGNPCKVLRNITDEDRKNFCK